MSLYTNIHDWPAVHFESTESSLCQNTTPLYGIEPFGIGTRTCESLKSYILRLADKHRVSSKALWEELCSISTTSKFVCTKNRPYFSCCKVYFSVGEWSAGLVNSLYQATSVSTSVNCTMLPINNILSTKKLMTNYDRHCPLCLQESFQRNNLYSQLIWNVACVTACHDHKIQLVTSECGAPVENRLSHYKKKIMAGVCAKCGSVGYSCRKEETVQASDEEIWKARQVAELIASYPVAAQMYSRTNTVNGLKTLIDTFAGGKYSRAARYSGIYKSVLCGWLQEKYLPSLGLLLDLCLTASVSLVSLLQGKPTVIESPIATLKPNKQPTQKPSLKDREKALKEALLSNESPSLKAVASLLGIDVSMLRRQFKNLSGLVSEKHRQFLATQMALKHKFERELALSLIADLQSNGLPLTQRNLGYAYGKPILPNTQMYRVLQEIRGDAEKQTAAT